jgi:hypothetical protein
LWKDTEKENECLGELIVSTCIRLGPLHWVTSYTANLGEVEASAPSKFFLARREILVGRLIVVMSQPDT